MNRGAAAATTRIVRGDRGAAAATTWTFGRDRRSPQAQGRWRRSPPATPASTSRRSKRCAASIAKISRCSAQRCPRRPPRIRRGCGSDGRRRRTSRSLSRSLLPIRRTRRPSLRQKVRAGQNGSRRRRGPVRGDASGGRRVGPGRGERVAAPPRDQHDAAPESDRCPWLSRRWIARGTVRGQIAASLRLPRGYSAERRLALSGTNK